MRPAETADELAGTFRAKSQLPTEGLNQYKELHYEMHEEQRGFLRLRARTAHKISKNLDEHSGTGPDRMPADREKASG